MKKLLAAALGAAIVTAAILVATPVLAGGSTASYMHPKSSLRYRCLQGTYSGSTTSLTGQVLGTVPPGRHVLKCVEVSQTATGTATAGTVTIDPKLSTSTTSLLSTSAQVATSTGANKTIDNAACPMPSIDPGNTSTTGVQLPVINSTLATAKGGEVATFDATLAGTYTVAPSGIVRLCFEPVY